MSRKFLFVLLGFVLILSQFLAGSSARAAGVGDLIKLPSNNYVYYLGTDTKRHPIPNISGYEAYRNAVMNSWGWADSNVVTISQSEFESYSLGENVFIKANTYHLKIETGVEIYNVERDNVLKRIDSTVNHPYGWNDFVIIPDSIFATYQLINEKPDLSTSLDVYGDGGGVEYQMMSFVGYIQNEGGANSVAKSPTYRFCVDNADCLNSRTGSLSGNDGVVQGDIVGGKPAQVISSMWVTTAGNHTIYLCADPGKTIEETDENNNCISYKFHIAEENSAKPDLIVKNIEYIKQWQQNGKDYLVAEVCNTGLADMSNNPDALVRGKLSSNGNFISYSLLTAPYLEKGECVKTGGSADYESFSKFINNTSRTINVTFQIDDFCEINNFCQIDESNENNNILTKTITIPAIDAKPDLKITDLEYYQADGVTKFTGNPTVGQSFSVRPIIKNIGTANSTAAFWIENYIDNIAGYGSGQFDQILKPGQTYLAGAKKVSFSVSGVHEFKFVVDAKNQVAESDENNNMVIRNITIGSSNTCTDSDGGQDYYVRGYVEAYENAVDTFKDRHYDYCGVSGEEKNNLIEYICGDNNYVKKVVYRCPNG